MNASDAALPEPLLRLLETGLRRVLALDPDARAKLKPLEGRRVALKLKPVEAWVGLSVVDGELKAEALAADGAADLKLATTPGALLALAAERQGVSLPAGRIEINGDAELARRVQKLIAQLDPDFAEPLSRVFGDVLGHQLAKGLRGAFGWLRETGQAMLLNGSEYLREESRDLVAPTEMEAFSEGVEQVRDGVARAEQRLERLLARRARRTDAR